MKREVILYIASFFFYVPKAEGIGGTGKDDDSGEKWGSGSGTDRATPLSTYSYIFLLYNII